MHYCKQWTVSFKTKQEYHRCLLDPAIISQIKQKDHACFNNQEYNWNVTLKKRNWTTSVGYIFDKYQVRIQPSNIQTKPGTDRKGSLKVNISEFLCIRNNEKKKEVRDSNERNKSGISRKKKLKNKEEKITAKLWRLCIQLS